MTPVPVSSPSLRRHAQFQSEFLAGDRDVLVWLPPGYNSDGGSDQRADSRANDPPNDRVTDRLSCCYPVLYMHDGQNLFDPETAFLKGQHWRLGETAADLIGQGRIEPIIVVGIHNTGDSRLDEYTPTPDDRLGGGMAAEYGRMLVDELKPFIDATYRTLPGGEHTGVGGSSLGGLLTLFLGFTYPHTFRKLAVLSPSVWWDHRAILDTVRRARPTPRPRLWVDMGTAEGERGLEDARLLRGALIGGGWLDGVDLRYREFEGATHTETAWAERIGAVLEWLFPTSETTARTIAGPAETSAGVG